MHIQNKPQAPHTPVTPATHRNCTHYTQTTMFIQHPKTNNKNKNKRAGHRGQWEIPVFVSYEDPTQTKFLRVPGLKKKNKQGSHSTKGRRRCGLLWWGLQLHANQRKDGRLSPFHHGSEGQNHYIKELPWRHTHVGCGQILKKAGRRGRDGTGPRVQ